MAGMTRRRLLELAAGATAFEAASCSYLEKQLFPRKTRSRQPPSLEHPRPPAEPAPPHKQPVILQPYEPRSEQRQSLAEVVIEENKRAWPLQEVIDPHFANVPRNGVSFHEWLQQRGHTFGGKEGVITYQPPVTDEEEKEFFNIPFRDDVSTHFNNVTIGQSIQLQGVTDQYKNKGLLVVAGATWCTPCLEELSILDYWYRNEQQKPDRGLLQGLEVIAVPFDADTEKARQEYGGTAFPVVYATSPLIRDFYKYMKDHFPANFVLDADHRLLWATPHLLNWTTRPEDARGDILLIKEYPVMQVSVYFNPRVQRSLEAAADSGGRKQQEEERKRHREERVELGLLGE